MTARLVLDTSVFVAAIRSPSGASARLLDAALDGAVELLLSPALMFEYEDVAARPEHLEAAGITAAELGAVLDAVAATGRWIHIDYSWRPSLGDPDDELIFDLALNGAADALVTFNIADFETAANLVGLPLMRPGRALSFLDQVR